MSGWSIINNTFINCEQGGVIGGGRRNTFSGNYYERCDLALHIDNRGMGGKPPSQVPNCTSVCKSEQSLGLSSTPPGTEDCSGNAAFDRPSEMIA